MKVLIGPQCCKLNSWEHEDHELTSQFSVSQENCCWAAGGLWGRLVTGGSGLELQHSSERSGVWRHPHTLESTARKEIQRGGNRITNKIEEKLKEIGKSLLSCFYNPLQHHINSFRLTNNKVTSVLSEILLCPGGDFDKQKKTPTEYFQYAPPPPPLSDWTPHPPSPTFPSVCSLSCFNIFIVL